MELDELNHAGEAGVFGSLRVLGDVNSKNIQLIKRDVSVLQNVSTKMNYKLDKYWTSLSDDGIITAPEKLSLKKEWDAIVQTHAALLAQATAKALTSTSYWQDYQDAYEDLYELLYVTEKLFDNMEVDTTISDVDNFNTIFNDYYYAEQFVQLAIVSGLIDKLGLRGLENLEEEGTEGELAFYRGELYQYHSDAWVRIGTETYLGVITTHVQQLDEASEGQYFLAGGVFQYESALYANDEVLIANNEPIMLVFSTVVGNLYYFDGIGWELAADDDPRYVAILADYINLMGKVPLLLEEKIDDVVREPTNGPQYKGVSNTIPTPVKKGDWFVYSGTTVGTTWIKDRIYRYDGEAWEFLDPDNDGNSRYYMSALQDILALEEAGDGYFSTLFCNAFFANKASINALKVQTIYLYDTGAIQSQDETYVPETVGLRIDAAGNIDANGDTHIGGSGSIGGDIRIYGQVRGDLDIEGTAILRGTTIIEGNASFSGDINSGPLVLQSQSPQPRTETWNAGAHPKVYLYGGIGLYGNIEFDEYDYDYKKYGNGDEYYKYFWYKNGVLVASKSNWTESGIQYNMSYTFTLPSGTKTLKLIDIPTIQPGEPNVVWRDTGGVLKLS